MLTKFPPRSGHWTLQLLNWSLNDQYHGAYRRTAETHGQEGRTVRSSDSFHSPGGLRGAPVLIVTVMLVSCRLVAVAPASWVSSVTPCTPPETRPCAWEVTD